MKRMPLFTSRANMGLYATCLAVLLGFAPHAALAQDVPASASPDRIREQVVAPQTLSAPSADISIPEIRIEGAPEGAENVRFTLNSLTLEGASAYPESELATLYAQDIGQDIPLTRLYEIAAQITRKYRADGYIITQVVVPQQTIDSGNARLTVVEGALENVTVQGEVTETDRVLIQQLANKLTRSAPLGAKDLERYLLLINDLAGVKARSIIGPSATPGKADMTIIIDRTPVNALLGVDNYGSRYLGPWQATAAAQINNPFGHNDRLLAQIVTAPQDDEMYYTYFAYDLPVGTEGTILSTDASYSNTAPGHDIRIFKPKGHSAVLGATLKHPFIRTRNENLTGFIRFDFNNAGTTNLLGVKTDDHIRSLRIGGSYERLSTTLGTSVNTLSGQLSQGLDIFNASEKDDARLSRPDGDPQYTKIEVEYARLQRIQQGLNALIAIKGQKASGPLLSAEEFGLGGMGSGYGRGYDPSEITGEHGIAAKAELQWNTGAFAGTLDGLQLYGFYDVGTVWDDDATTSSNRRISIASTGIGARAHYKGISADATMAVPLTRDVAVEGDTDPRFFISLTTRF